MSNQSKLHMDIESFWNKFEDIRTHIIEQYITQRVNVRQSLKRSCIVENNVKQDIYKNMLSLFRKNHNNENVIYTAVLEISHTI